MSTTATLDFQELNLAELRDFVGGAGPIAPIAGGLAIATFWGKCFEKGVEIGKELGNAIWGD